MTGYGRSAGVIGDKKVVVEVRSLNSKGLDLSMKMPQSLKEKEMVMRKLATSKIMRGKAEISIQFEGGTDRRANINQDLAADYHQQITSLADRLNLDSAKSDLLNITLKMPEVLQADRGGLSAEEWEGIQRMLNEAMAEFDIFRKKEGQLLSDDLEGNVDKIVNYRTQVAPYIDGRIDRIRERIQKNIDQVMEGKDVDADRLEQEIVFYIEKYDVSEEMSRLAGHLDYFKESLAAEDGGGKKLGFISQEIGREINTLGAKAYDSDMQRIVVEMKESLEKIKEQVLNVL